MRESEMPFQIIRNDITKVKADAIVNTANPEVRVGAGTDSAIYQAAGKEQLLEARKNIGPLAPGQAAYTEAFGLNANYIIHTVGPVWIDGNHGERDILHLCYKKSLEIAAELACRSVAFPLIASGTYGFPKDEALSIALSEISNFLLTHEMKVVLVVFDRKAVELSRKVVGEIKHYIDDAAAQQIRERERDGYNVFADRRRKPPEEWAKSEAVPIEQSSYVLEDVTLAGPGKRAEFYRSLSEASLDDVLKNPESSFKNKLFELIDERGMTDAEVYKKANIDRKVFSSIRCKEGYTPKKRTILALAIALKLDIKELIDLLSRAEMAFSPSSKSDLIVMYFVEHGIYDIYEINAALFRYGEKTLG